jgi:hypothetical protein
MEQEENEQELVAVFLTDADGRVASGELLC